MERMIREVNDMFHFHDLKEYEEHPLPIHKICFIARSQKAVETVKKQLSYKYRFIIHELFSTQTINGEIIIKGIDKGKAIHKVVEYLGLSMQDTICFGDSMNDLEMVKTCEYSVVMNNGTDELKKYASSICESVDNDGVYHEMVRLGLCEELK
jgi:hypothetical protein